MENRPSDFPVTMQVGRDTSIDTELGFPANGVGVDNNTSQWVYVNDANRFVAPNTSRQFGLKAARSGKAKFAAPAGKTQAATVAGEECILVFTSEPLPTTGAQVPSVLSATAIASLNLIQDTLLTVAAATIDFLAIPSSSKHLLLVASLRQTGATLSANVNMRLNADAAANYDCHCWEIGAAVLSSVADFGVGTFLTVCNSPAATAPAGRAGALSLWIPDYAGTTLQKALHAEAQYGTTDAAGGMRTNGMTGAWLNTAAITQVSLLPANPLFAIGSRATLYGFA